MDNQGSQDAYARFDITNLLSGYDVDWAERINKNAALTPSLYQRIQTVFELSTDLTNINGISMFELLKNHMPRLGRTKFFTALEASSECNTFFYGNMSVANNKDDDSEPLPPIMILNRVFSCDLTLRTPYTLVSCGTNYNAPNAIMYGSSPLVNILSNWYATRIQTGAPDGSYRLILDGIVICIPKNP